MRLIAFGTGTQGERLVYFGTQKEGLWLSTDNGVSFTQISGISAAGSIYDIHSFGQRVIAATGGG